MGISTFGILAVIVILGILGAIIYAVTKSGGKGPGNDD